MAIISSRVKFRKCLFAAKYFYPSKNICRLITDVVLAEAVWTLIGKRYNLDKATVRCCTWLDW